MSQSLSSLLARAQVWNGSAWVKAPGDAANGLDVDVTRSALPTGASTEATLAGVKTGTDKIPASPAQEHSTAASPHSARLTDGATYLGSTAQRLHVDDGGSSLSVDDNAGSLTVDSAQLPGALAAGGGMKVEGVAGGVAQPVSGTFWQATQPVSMATQTPDVTDRAARELGRARIWDGTDEATVLPVRTQPAATEKALNVIELPSRLAEYGTVTAEVAVAITIGVKEGLCLWHVSTGTKDIYVVELWAAFIVTTASTTGGRTTVRVSTVTTAPTGGTDEAVADLSGAGASTEMTNRMRAKTGGGAIGATFVRKGVEHATQPLGNQNVPLFVASTLGDAIVLRAGSGQGISIDVERVVAHTALVDQWTFGARWIEL